MPIQRCTTKGRARGWRWGRSGKCYRSRAKAIRQMRAIKAAGWTENAFCPTGPGGGVDPTCSPGHVGGAVVSFNDLGATWRNGLKTEAAKKKFDAMSDDALITVYHGTTRDRGESLLRSRVVAVPKGYRSDLPTQAKDSLYVAPTKADAEKYGSYIVTFTIRKGDIKPSPEALSLNPKTSLTKAFFNSFDGAILPPGHRLEDIIIANVRSRRPKSRNPLRRDPTRTLGLRREFQREMTRRFELLRRDVRALLVEEDAFGLEPKPNYLTGNVFCPTGPGGGIDPTCSKGGFRTVYHGTPASLVEKIRVEGLLSVYAGKTYGEISGKGAVFIAEHPAEAEFWAKYSQANAGRDYAILTIEVPDESTGRFTVDPHADKMPPKIRRLTGRDSTAMTFTGDIPPGWIKSVRVVKR